MTYQSTLAEYRRLLADRAGEALEIGDGCYAVFVDGHLYGVHEVSSGAVTLDNGFDFDMSAWDEDGECWEGDVSGFQTSNAIANPRYVEITKS